MERIAVERPSRQFWHCPYSVWLAILKASKASVQHIDAAKLGLCDGCIVSAPSAKRHKAPPLKLCTVNHWVGLGVLEIAKVAEEQYRCLKMVDQGAAFQIVTFARTRGGNPSSNICRQSVL